METHSIVAEIKSYEREWRQSERERRRLRMASFRRSLPRLTGIALAGLLLIYLALALPVSWYQTRLIYWNEVPGMDWTQSAGWEVRRYVSHDDSTQLASYVHAGDPDKPTVVYLHGRGEHHGIFRYNTAPYTYSGWTVVIPEYPGFAGLAGTPSEESIGTLMRRVHEDLVDRGTDPQDIVIHGNSLGGGPAMQLAQLPHELLVLSAPVATMERMMSHFAAYYPAFLLRDDWDNLDMAVTRHEAPTIVVHSADDLVVPVEQGRDMARALGARYVEYDDRGHAVGAMAAGIAQDEMERSREAALQSSMVTENGSRGRT